MAGGGGDQHDLFARANEPVTVQDGESLQGPARQRIGRDRRDLRFRHARIMFEFERRERPRFVAAEAREAHQRAYVGPALQQQRLLARRVEGPGAEADGGRDQPSPRSSAGKRRSRGRL